MGKRWNIEKEDIHRHFEVLQVSKGRSIQERWSSVLRVQAGITNLVMLDLFSWLIRYFQDLRKKIEQNVGLDHCSWPIRCMQDLRTKIEQDVG
ncbi:hypothetical protein NDU88_003474 [Pleurodeles waltl]|uniref:Uncharacterized protein n=1 Tax=Pleurodeles waltl TaxID=8319 RepID=A0AAV7TNN7_PLEWA|nr:hypothetical protein NDU88_003474 [Pleurodeles waltl]